MAAPIFDLNTRLMPMFAIMGDGKQEIDKGREMVRQQIAFYASTRTYKPVFDVHDWGDVRTLKREGRERSIGSDGRRYHQRDVERVRSDRLVC